MNERWVNDEVWQEREIYNRAPRPALIECEPSVGTRCVRIVRVIARFMLVVGVMTMAVVGMFYMAQK